MIGERRLIMEQNIRVSVIGRREGIAENALREMDETIAMSAANSGMQLCLAINYGSRGELVDACRRIARQRSSVAGFQPEAIDEETIAAHLYTAGMPEPDLLIRTAQGDAGEQLPPLANQLRRDLGNQNYAGRISTRPCCMPPFASLPPGIAVSADWESEAGGTVFPLHSGRLTVVAGFTPRLPIVSSLRDGRRQYLGATSMFSHALHRLSSSPSYLAQVDPRARIAAAVALALLMAIARSVPAMAVALTAAIGVVALARASPGDFIRRLLPLEMLLVVVVVVVPWPSYDREGIRLAVVIALKANVVVLVVAALIGTMDAVTLGHALAHFRVPAKLTQLLLFMVRYFDVLGREYSRLGRQCVFAAFDRR